MNHFEPQTVQVFTRKNLNGQAIDTLSKYHKKKNKKNRKNTDLHSVFTVLHYTTAAAAIGAQLYLPWGHAYVI